MPLYINKIKEASKKKRIPINEIAQLIGISGNGLHLALKNDTLKVRDLQKIAEVLGIDIREFFEKEANTVRSYSYQRGTGNVNQQGIKNKIGADKTELLKQENAHLKEKIELQAQLIEALRK